MTRPAFARAYNLKCHLKKSRGGVCLGSRRALTHDGAADTSKVQHSDDPFKCDLCPRAYPYKQSLNQHVLRVHGTGGGDSFPCTLCPKKFSQKHRLTVHMSNAHGEHGSMPNLCVVCSQRFVSPFTLRKHMADKHHKKVAMSEA